MANEFSNSFTKIVVPVVGNTVYISLSEYSSNIYSYGFFNNNISVIKRLTVNNSGSTQVTGYRLIEGGIQLDSKIESVMNLACSPTQHKGLIIASYGSSYTLFEFDTEKNLITSEITRLEVPTSAYNSVCYSPNGEEVFMCRETAVDVYHAEGLIFKKTIFIQNGSALDISMIPDGSGAYLGNSNTTAVSRILPMYDQFIANIDDVEYRGSMASSHDSSKCYFAGVGEITVVDNNTMKIIKSIQGGSLFGGMATSPYHPYLFAITGVNEMFMEIINTNIDTKVDTIPLNVGSISIVTDQFGVAYISNDAGYVTIILNNLVG